MWNNPGESVAILLKIPWILCNSNDANFQQFGGSEFTVTQTELKRKYTTNISSSNIKSLFSKDDWNFSAKRDGKCYARFIQTDLNEKCIV